jgi:ribonuclease P protein component
MPPESSASGVGRLKRRPEFLAVAGARRKWVAPGLILQARRHDDRQHPDAGEPSLRVGFTASKKVGNAVARNRAKRRLRAAARTVLPARGRPGWDYVLIGRPEATAARPFASLCDDLAGAIAAIHAPKGEGER